jgi:hypothetical protein
LEGAATFPHPEQARRRGPARVATEACAIAGKGFGGSQGARSATCEIRTYKSLCSYQIECLTDRAGLQYPARSINSIKAQENWKHRSLFIHSEIVKYEVYTDALKSAINLRFKKQGEKKLEKSLKRNMEIDENEDDFYDYLHATNVRLTPVERR